MRVAFDIGGVLSKYPEIFRPMALGMHQAGDDVFVITDMRDMPDILKTLRINSLGFIPEENVYSADYDLYGEGCKAEALNHLKIDLFFDDFIGYTAEACCAVRCLVMPDATKPYYADSWTTTGGELDFGRKRYVRK